MDVMVTSQGLARREDDEVALLDLPYRDVSALIADAESLEPARHARVTGRLALDEVLPGLRAPLPTPGTVWGVGLNYRSKARVTGREVPSEPILYVAGRSSVAGPGDALPYPDGCTSQLDMEAEIAVVIGRRLYRADERDVWAAVAGITAGNDLTARDVMKQTGVPALAKSFPGCTPLGASVLAVDDVPDVSAIGVRGWVDGVLRQDDTSADMLWSIPELLARISWFAALEPGDVFLSGTPSGTGQDRGVYLQPGSEVTVEVDGVLPLHTTVVAAAASRAPAPDPRPAPAGTVPVS